MNDSLGELPSGIGQVFVAREPDRSLGLCHRDDVERGDLTIYEHPEGAIEIARFDDAGAYRPLKTAPNLRHGWKLLLRDAAEVRQALEFFYPGRLAVFRRWKDGTLGTTSLRETLGRQSGMYRVAARISDEEGDEVVANVCRSDGGCLRTILWQRDLNGGLASRLLPAAKFDPKYDQTGRGEETLPLLCQEACNILVARIREAVKT